MKFFKLSMLLLHLSSMLITAACSEEAPSINVRNDYRSKVNVQLKPSVGNTININEVASGETSSFIDVMEGSWTATASVQASSAEPAATFSTSNDNNYTVIITNSEPPEMTVKVNSK